VPQSEKQQENNMKPFSLEEALAGSPVCTRDGRTVTQLVKFDAVSSCDTPYIRADIVDGLVEALEKIAALEDTEEDEWDGVERVIPLMASTAKTALIVIFGGLAFSDYNKTQIELAKIEMLKRLRDERDALLKDVSALVDDDFGANGWSNEMDSAAMRLRQLVGKMRADYDE
jgi:hypothetical protein